MTDKGIDLHLASMVRAAENAIRLTADISYDDFVAKPDTQAAAAMYLIIIGEAANRIAQRAVSDAVPPLRLPLDQMRGLRNRIVHDYETLHLPTIWATIREALPVLLSDLKSAGEPPQTAT